MSDSPRNSESGDHRLSRSAIGRVSGAVSNLFGGLSTVQATGRFLRQQLWAWPIVAALVFGSAGWWVHSSVENAMHNQRAVDLDAMADTSVTSLRTWMGEQRVNVTLIADDELVRRFTNELLALQKEENPERRLLNAKPQADLRHRLKAKLDVCGYTGFVLISPEGVHLASDQDLLVGKPLPEGYRREYFGRAFAGESTVSKPYRSSQLHKDDAGVLRANQPTMFVAGPVHDTKARSWRLWVCACARKINSRKSFK